MPPAYVKPYVKRGKTDAADAEAVCEAVRRPTMRFVPVKSPEQQAARPVHRQRCLLLGRLHRHKPHRRPPYRFANRFCIGSVGLAALHVRLDVSRRHQAQIMTEGATVRRLVGTDATSEV